MGNRNKPIILEDDISLLTRIAKHGYIDMEYVHHFLYKKRKKRTIEDRIAQLATHGYLAIDRTFIPPNYTASYRTGYRIITLGLKGLRLMHDMGYDVIDNLNTIRNSSPYRKYHQVQVSTVCDTLTECYISNQSNWVINKVLNERESCFEEIQNRPDAILIYKPSDASKNQELNVAVYLEIERSYASINSLERKLLNYHQSFSMKSYQNLLKEPIISNRILFVAQTNQQKNTLLEKLKNCELSSKLDVLVTGYQDINSSPLATIYQIPYANDMVKMLGQLPSR